MTDYREASIQRLLYLFDSVVGHRSEKSTITTWLNKMSPIERYRTESLKNPNMINSISTIDPECFNMVNGLMQQIGLDPIFTDPSDYKAIAEDYNYFFVARKGKDFAKEEALARKQEALEHLPEGTTIRKPVPKQTIEPELEALIMLEMEERTIDE